MVMETIDNGGYHILWQVALAEPCFGPSHVA